MSKEKPKKKRGCLKGCLVVVVVFILFIIIMALIPGGDDSSKEGEKSTGTITESTKQKEVTEKSTDKKEEKSTKKKAEVTDKTKKEVFQKFGDNSYICQETDSSLMFDSKQKIIIHMHFIPDSKTEYTEYTDFSFKNNILYLTDSKSDKNMTLEYDSADDAFKNSKGYAYTNSNTPIESSENTLENYDEIWMTNPVGQIQYQLSAEAIAITKQDETSIQYKTIFYVGEQHGRVIDGDYYIWAEDRTTSGESEIYTEANGDKYFLADDEKVYIMGEQMFFGEQTDNLELYKTDYTSMDTCLKFLNNVYQYCNADKDSSANRVKVIGTPADYSEAQLSDK